jgi:hypothetical protein
MKMLKKCLIAIAVVALLAVTVQADTAKIKRNPWPTEYKLVDICEIPVSIEVGWYIEIEDCQDLEIVLEQVPCSELKVEPGGADEYPCYEGCEKFGVRANFDAELDLELVLTSDIIDDHAEGISDDGITYDVPFIQPASGTFVELDVCVDAWNVDFTADLGATPGDEVSVGTLIIQARPI